MLYKDSGKRKLNDTFVVPVLQTRGTFIGAPVWNTTCRKVVLVLPLWLIL